ncbi:F-box protein [Quillaja saponaria]|uniref:F-box protein n=1 Tax=Quillaja saponaria TaxID=32244 RepID=A0AAD7M320_QUISA|nr:F-box protein [Quillaja saponaria]
MESSSDPQQQHKNPNWLELPRDLITTILLKLGAIEILTSAQNVCSLWREICMDPLMWRAIDMHNLGDLLDIPYGLEIMCRHAIDRSCGQLVDINIEYFGTDELLKYITDSTSQLRRLQLRMCNNISDEGLIVAVRKLPLLEELEISYCSFSTDPLGTVGHSCPLLKSLRLNNKGSLRAHLECNEEALAIAESMHGLRHLQLFGNKLTNDGLLAILDGCPELESLDLRQCFYVSLGGNLGRRCVEQIKDLKLPDDSTIGYEFDASIEDNGSFDEDYPSGFSDIDLWSNDYDYDFSGGSDLTDYEDPYWDY